MYIRLFTVQCPDSLLHRSTLVLFLCDCVFSSFTHFLQLSMDSKETVRTSNVMLSPFRSFPQFLHNPGQFTGKPIWASTLEATSQLRSSWEGFQKKQDISFFRTNILGRLSGKTITNNVWLVYLVLFFSKTLHQEAVGHHPHCLHPHPTPHHHLAHDQLLQALLLRGRRHG